MSLAVVLDAATDDTLLSDQNDGTSTRRPPSPARRFRTARSWPPSFSTGATADRGRRQGPLGSISSESPLYSAAVRGNYAVLKELLRGGASHVMTPWIYPTESLQGALKFC